MFIIKIKHKLLLKAWEKQIQCNLGRSVNYKFINMNLLISIIISLYKITIHVSY